MNQRAKYRVKEDATYDRQCVGSTLNGSNFAKYAASGPSRLVSIATLRVRIVQNCVELLQSQGYGDEPRDRAVVYRVRISVADALPSQVVDTAWRQEPEYSDGWPPPVHTSTGLGWCPGR